MTDEEVEDVVHVCGERPNFITLDVLAEIIDVPVKELTMFVPHVAGLQIIDKALVRRIFLAGVECRSGAVASVVVQFEEARRPRKAIPNAVRLAVMTRDGRICGYCGKTIGPRSNFHLDHITPVRDGGLNTEDNLTVACPRCNMNKGDSPGWRDFCGHLRFDTQETCSRCAREAR